MRFWDSSALVPLLVSETTTNSLEWAQGNPLGREIVCLDDRLRQAAQQEGFTVTP